MKAFVLCLALVGATASAAEVPDRAMSCSFSIAKLGADGYPVEAGTSVGTKIIERNQAVTLSGAGFTFAADLSRLCPVAASKRPPGIHDDHVFMGNGRGSFPGGPPPGCADDYTLSLTLTYGDVSTNIPLEIAGGDLTIFVPSIQSKDVQAQVSCQWITK